MTVELKGSSPHDLPIAQSATAEVLDETVQVTFRVLDEETHREVSVRIRLMPEAARNLGVLLPIKAGVAERWARIHK